MARLSNRPRAGLVGSWLTLAGAAVTASLILAAVPAGCTLDDAGTRPPPITTPTGTAGGGGATGGTTATGGIGGQAGQGGSPECTTPTECPGQDTECGTRTCTNEICGMDYAAVGAPCTEGGADVCDGAGNCVKSDGLPCADPSECLSGFCVDDVCCATACGGICEACHQSGSEGVCTPYDPATDPDGECAPGVCDGSSACAIGGHLFSARFGDGNNERAWHIAVDGAGNAFVTGNFLGSVNFGGSLLTSQGGWDVFVAKFDPSGNHLWSQRFGDSSNQFASGLATDGAGNVIVVGTYWGEIDFGGSTLTSAGNRDLYVAKLDPDGNHLHSARFGDGSDQFGVSVATDSTDSFAVAGRFLGSVDFGGGTLTSAGNRDAYVAKFSSGGAHQWSQRFGDSCNDYGSEVAFDSADRVVLAGYFACGINFGGGAMTSAGGWDIYAAQFGSAGNHLWSNHYGSSVNQECFGLDVDAADNVLLTGRFFGSVNFGGGDLTDAGAGDVYVAKLDSSGNHLWSQRFGNTSEQGGYGVAADAAGNVFLLGDIMGSADFGGGVLTSAGSWDAFVAKFAPNGTHLWSQLFGDSNVQYGNDGAVDTNGNFWLTGYFTGSVNFGGNTLTASGEDIYVAKFAP